MHMWMEDIFAYGIIGTWFIRWKYGRSQYMFLQKFGPKFSIMKYTQRICEIAEILCTQVYISNSQQLNNLGTSLKSISSDSTSGQKVSGMDFWALRLVKNSTWNGLGWALMKFEAGLSWLKKSYSWTHQSQQKNERISCYPKREK